MLLSHKRVVNKKKFLKRNQSFVNNTQANLRQNQPVKGNFMPKSKRLARKREI